MLALSVNYGASKTRISAETTVGAGKERRGARTASRAKQKRINHFQGSALPRATREAFEKRSHRGRTGISSHIGVRGIATPQATYRRCSGSGRTEDDGDPRRMPRTHGDPNTQELHEHNQSMSGDDEHETRWTAAVAEGIRTLAGKEGKQRR